ncbi:gametogenetin-like [Dendrobium catenatum]|uniref:gametogenetin-like n=1 Tax=Dendrobium catenatum TaxID=906689 RepID=UPI00109F2280|nr:gametogenetin-like [Dendrobium catenatum]
MVELPAIKGQAAFSFTPFLLKRSFSQNFGVKAQKVAPAPQRRQPAAVVPPVRVAVRRPAPAAPVAQAARAPQRPQPAAVVTPVVPAEVPRVRVPPPASTRKRGAQTKVPSPSSGRISIFAWLSHPETVGQTPALPVVPVLPATQAVGSDVPSTSTSGLGRRAQRNRNRRLRLAASEAERQRMADDVVHDEIVQR